MLLFTFHLWRESQTRTPPLRGGPLQHAQCRLVDRRVKVGFRSQRNPAKGCCKTCGGDPAWIAKVGLKRLDLWRYEIAATSCSTGFATSPSYGRFGSVDVVVGH
jgi:hypothetical protein